MSPVIPTEYAIAGMVLLPLLVGIFIWIIKDKQLQRLHEQLITEQNRHEADQRVTEDSRRGIVGDEDGDFVKDARLDRTVDLN